MIPKTKLTFLISAAAVSLGLALSAAGQGTDVAPAASVAEEPGVGLLGTGYTALTFRYTDLDNGPPSALRGAGIEFNQAWKPGLDFKLDYDWARANAAPIRVTYQDLNTGATLFSKLDWGKPYVQALAGWEWRRGGGSTDNSFAFTLGTGVEFQVARLFAVTPYINFVRAVSFNRNEIDYGVKATYRLSRQWSLSAGAELNAIRDTKDSMTYTGGVNYHF